MATSTQVLTLTDKANNSRVVSWPVNVTVPGKTAIDKSSVWHGQRFNVRFSNVPAGTTKITLRYGDGTGIKLAGKDQVVGGIYHLKPNGMPVPTNQPLTLTAVYTNRLGDTSQIVIGKITIKTDVSVPRFTITTPKNPNRVSSWKTLRGTASDQGSGVYRIALLVARTTGTKDYCYSSKKSWIRVYNDSAPPKACQLYIPVAGGKWSLSLNGLQKGGLVVFGAPIDWASNAGEVDGVAVNLSRS